MAQPLKMPFLLRSETLVDDESTVSTADTETCNVDVDDAQSCTAEHAQSDETLIIFDWDDTLCPSTFLGSCCGLDMDGPPLDEEVAEALEEFASEVGALLHLSKELASRVVVVTNASEGWVEESCQAWMPQLLGALEHVEISSARSTWEPRGVATPTSWKAREFETVIDQLQSWKNVIVVGDAHYEHDALRRVVKGVPRSQPWGKSVKFAYRPSIEELTIEIQALRSQLRSIINRDGNLDLSVSLGGVFMTTPPVSSLATNYRKQASNQPEYSFSLEEPVSAPTAHCNEQPAKNPGNSASLKEPGSSTKTHCCQQSSKNICELLRAVRRVLV